MNKSGKIEEKDAKLISLVQELHERSISKNIAAELTEAHPAEYIQDKIRLHDDMKAAGNLTRNPAGFLRTSIEDGYHFPKERRQKIQKTAERNTRAHATEDRRECWFEHERPKRIEQELKDWDKTTPEERIQPIFTFWLKSIYKGSPNSEGARAKKQDYIYIGGLPITEVRTPPIYRAKRSPC